MRRAMAQSVFATTTALAAILGIAIVAAGQYWIANAQAEQERRNTYLREETAKLDQQIKEIAELKQKTSGLIARKDVIESLQTNRGESVRLFIELASRVPEGLYLKSLKQTGDNFVITGYAQSSARVSSLMRALEASDLFKESILVEVKAAQVGSQRLNEFTLNVALDRAAKSGNKGGAT
jgi:type IV pilus assembly protein PilN